MKIKKSLSTKNILPLLLFFLLNSKLTFAQNEETILNPSYYNIMAILLLAVIVLIFFAFLYFGMDARESKETVKETESLWRKFRNYVAGMEPMEKEKDILMEHDYDGIEELDNRIPPWFNWLFYGTIIFGVWYMLHFHVFQTGKLQIEEYKEEVRQAEIQKVELIKSGAFITAETVEYDTSASALNTGKEIFDKNCVPCHGPDGGGTVGPNLTDNFWIHGGGIKNIFLTVKNGVPAKGMVAWENQLNPKQMQAVSSYVWSLQGTEPAAGKPPEGQKYQPEQNMQQ